MEVIVTSRKVADVPSAVLRDGDTVRVSVRDLSPAIPKQRWESSSVAMDGKIWV